MEGHTPFGSLSSLVFIMTEKINNIDAKVQALEVKVDKIIKHFGI